MRVGRGDGLFHRMRENGLGAQRAQAALVEQVRHQHELHVRSDFGNARLRGCLRPAAQTEQQERGRDGHGSGNEGPGGEEEVARRGPEPPSVKDHARVPGERFLDGDRRGVVFAVRIERFHAVECERAAVHRVEAAADHFAEVRDATREVAEGDAILLQHGGQAERGRHLGEGRPHAVHARRGLGCNDPVDEGEHDEGAEQKAREPEHDGRERFGTRAFDDLCERR